MSKLIKFSVLASIASVVLIVQPATAQTVNFDGITTSAAVNTYYNGGISSAGDVGPNYGIVFQENDWITTTSYGQTSSPNLAYSASGSGYVNFLSGITTGLNFSYGAFTDANLSVYTGLDGTGTLLGTYTLGQNDPFNFSFVALPFAGIGHSAVLSAGGGQFGWDDITFGSLVPGAVPEPGTWAMMLLGFGMMGFAARRRSSLKATVTYA
jgi:hypothetical protein